MYPKEPKERQFCEECDWHEDDAVMKCKHRAEMDARDEAYQEQLAKDAYYEAKYGRYEDELADLYEPGF